MFMRLHLRLPRRSVIPYGTFISAQRPAASLSARLASSSATSSSSSSKPSEAKMPADSSSSSSQSGAASATSADAQTAARQRLLPLAAPPQDETASGRGDDVTTLRVGETLRLDALGPLVINRDGSMSRVGNWAGMTEAEREATLRLLGRRNKQRLEALRAEKESQGEGTTTTTAADAADVSTNGKQ